MRATVVAVALGLLVAGCGGGLSASQVLSRAQERTADVETMRFTATGTAGGTRFEARGAIDDPARRSQLTADLGAAGSIELVLDRSVVYARVDGLRGTPLLPTPWISADLRRVGAMIGARLRELTELAEDGPSGALERLRAVGKVEELGRGRVRGVDTTHYRATVRPGPAAAGGGIPVDVWIDGDGLVRRLRATHASSAASVTIELYDFGADVGIEVPPRGEVTNLDSLLGASS